MSGTLPASAELRAGAAKVDITPDVKASKIPLGGYEARLAAPATGVHDPIYARALVLEVGGNVKVGIVSVELCFLPANIKAGVVHKLEAAGLNALAKHLMISATHTHTAPDPLAMHVGNTFQFKGWTSYDTKLTEFMEDKIAEAVIQADKRLLPAKIGSGTLELPGKNRNRRNEKTVDSTMTLLKVTDAEGRNLAAVVNFAAHPTLYNDKMMEISADWPGVMSGKLEKAMGGDAVCLFLNGAEGDATTSGAMGATADERVAFYGNMLADAAWDVLRIMGTQNDASMLWTSVEVTLPPRKMTGLFAAGATSIGATLEQGKQVLNGLMPEKTEIEFLWVGGVLFMGFPCEPTGDIGMAAKEAARKAGFDKPAVVALTNDWIAYALTPEQYHAGNYEAGMSLYGDQLGPTLLKAFTDKLPTLLKL
ncbi:MAG TPA: neutral/alkaline non-lysosomal ceramidase N-terminal domain-containing protein [Chthonomonadaceae bacterium]|nr:neutral/alkaline non-lysosomal ceramidase N-terminal domain-containing protein [Chthonomonadaceae bacterium]